MAARKESHPNKEIIVRITLMLFAWVAFIVFTLSCVSFSENDRMRVMIGGPAQYANWCGAVGSHIADVALRSIGPGVFVGIVLLGIAMVIWTQGKKVTQLPLRVIGAALLIASV